jgi:hypothetical protein
MPRQCSASDLAALGGGSVGVSVDRTAGHQRGHCAVPDGAGEVLVRAAIVERERPTISMVASSGKLRISSTVAACMSGVLEPRVRTPAAAVCGFIALSVGSANSDPPSTEWPCVCTREALQLTVVGVPSCWTLWAVE